MQKRLYNEYSAACMHTDKDIQAISEIMSKAAKEVWDIVKKNDICPRDAQLYCSEVLNGYFSENILVKAIKMEMKIKNDEEQKNLLRKFSS